MAFKKSHIPTALGLVLAALMWLTVAEIQESSAVPQTNKKYLKPPEALKHFTFGYNDFFASILWIRLQQNFDYCESGKYDSADFVQPIAGKDKIEGIVGRNIKASKCHKGWVYSMLDVISDIQPHFSLVYDTGAMFLSIIVDDREGARLIFEKGLKYYPNNWQLNYHAGYHYLWEVQEPKRSAELFHQAGINGAPQWAIALSAALYTRTGQAKIAKTILESALKNNPNGMDEERIKARLREAEAILQEK